MFQKKKTPTRNKIGKKKNLKICHARSSALSRRFLSSLPPFCAWFLARVFSPPNSAPPSARSPLRWSPAPVAPAAGLIRPPTAPEAPVPHPAAPGPPKGLRRRPPRRRPQCPRRPAGAPSPAVSMISKFMETTRHRRSPPRGP
jgi:hypothetical protein